MIRAMFVGHYSAAFAAKALAPRVPLWSLFVAVQLVDIAWAVFVMTGVERVALDPTLQSNALVLYFMPYTHSLVGTLAWAVGAGLLAGWLMRDVAPARVVGVAIFACVCSHWVLDLLVHRPDLPLLGDGSTKLGFALWNHPMLALGLELVCFAAAVIWVWQRRVLPSDKRLLGVAAAMMLFQVSTSFGPHPPNTTAVAGSVLSAFLVLAGVAVWLERGSRSDAARAEADQ